MAPLSCCAGHRAPRADECNSAIRSSVRASTKLCSALSHRGTPASGKQPSCRWSAPMRPRSSTPRVASVDFARAPWGSTRRTRAGGLGSSARSTEGAFGRVRRRKDAAATTRSVSEGRLQVTRRGVKEERNRELERFGRPRNALQSTALARGCHCRMDRVPEAGWRGLDTRLRPLHALRSAREVGVLAGRRPKS